MTEIKINNDIRLDTALKSAKEGEYEHALFLLRNNEDYESCINRVVFLLKSLEFTCGRELMWQYAARFALQYDYVQDMQYAVGKAFVDFTDEQLFLGNTPTSRKTCDRSKVWCTYSEDELTNTDDIVDEDFALAEYQQNTKGQIFDTSSYEYYEWLFDRAEHFYLRHEYKEEQKVAEQMSQYSGDDVDIAEMVLITLLRTGKFEQRSLQLAQWLDNKDLTDDGKLAVAEVFSKYSEYKQRAIQLVDSLYQRRDTLTWGVLVDSLRISNDKLKDKTLAVGFAQHIFEQQESATYFLLKKCIHVFFNFGQIELANKVAKHILSQHPNEVFCTAIVNYCSKHPKNTAPSALISPMPIYAHNILPAKVVRNLVRSLSAVCKDDERITCSPQLTSELSAYLWHLKGVYLVDNTTYVNGIRLCLRILQNVALLNKDVEYFAQFAKSYLCSGDTDVLVRAILLKWTYNIDKQGKVMVQTLSHPYFFDMQVLDMCEQDNDKLITVCFLAGVLPLSERKVASVLKHFDAIMKIKSKDNVSMAVSQMSYCILRRMYPTSSLTKYFPAFDDIDCEYWDTFALSDRVTPTENNETKSTQ